MRDDEGHAAKPPYRTVDNEGSILDVTDLVFIDPVTTGYSRAIPFEDANKFHGVDADIQSVGEFIRLWTTRYSRWASPKFLAGESYGTTRAAGLSGWLRTAGLLPQRHRADLVDPQFRDGVVRQRQRSAYELFLPTYTAIAWYHKRLPADLQSGTLEHADRRIRAIRPRRLHARADAGRPHQRRGAPRRRREAGARSPASRPTTSSRPTCASTSTASTRSCCATSAAPSAASTAASSASTTTPPARTTEFDPSLRGDLRRVHRGASTTTSAAS